MAEAVDPAPGCPNCVKLLALVEKLQARIDELERRLNESSSNSHKPPSSDPPWKPKPAVEKPTGRKPGGQPGHKGKTRGLYPPEEISEIRHYRPTSCVGCGHALSGDDPSPRRRQVADLPDIRPHVVEHCCHELECPTCGERTRAEFPADVPAGAFGDRSLAMVSFLTGALRLSKRDVALIMRDAFHLDMSVGTVSAREAETSGALAPAVDEARRYAAAAPSVGVDETGWTEARKRAWLWACVAASVAVFLVRRSRGAEVAHEIIDAGVKSVVTTDRWSAYSWLPLKRRQLCWAHLIRDFRKISECPEPFTSLGERLLECARRLFELWHRVRDGTLKRSSFQTYVSGLRQKIRAYLAGGGAYASSQRRPAAICRGILALESAMWTFARVEGVEPTNNAPERSLRHVVLWRNGSHGTHSAEGSRFVERILTTVATLRLQGRNVIEFLTATIRAARTGAPRPSLLPLR